MSSKPIYTHAIPPPRHGLDELDLDDDMLDDANDDRDPIELLRDRLGIDDAISDVTIAASLAAIAAKGDSRARWLAAFSSPIGKWLAAQGGDLNTALNVVMSFAPKAAS